MCTSIVPRAKPQRTRHQNNIGRQHHHLTFNTAHDPVFLKYARISYYPTSWFKGGGGDTVLPWNCPSSRRGGQLGRCDENGFTWYYPLPQQLHITQPPSVDNSGVFFNVSSKMFSAQNLVLMVGSWNRAPGVFRVMTGSTGRIWMCKHCCWPSQVGPGVLTGRVRPDPKVIEKSRSGRVRSGLVTLPRPTREERFSRLKRKKKTEKRYQSCEMKDVESLRKATEELKWAAVCVAKETQLTAQTIHRKKCV